MLREGMEDKEKKKTMKSNTMAQQKVTKLMEDKGLRSSRSMTTNGYQHGT